EAVGNEGANATCAPRVICRFNRVSERFGGLRPSFHAPSNICVALVHIALDCMAKYFRQMDSEFIADQYSDHAQRRAAQCIRVLTARRLLIDHPESNQSVDLVGKGD